MASGKEQAQSSLQPRERKQEHIYKQGSKGHPSHELQRAAKSRVIPPCFHLGPACPFLHIPARGFLCASTHTHTDYILFLPGRDIDLENIKTTSEPSAQLLTKQKVKKE